MGRQVRFTFEEEHYRVDLVFFNRLLRCFVLFDLKVGQLKHQDIGYPNVWISMDMGIIQRKNRHSRI